MYNYVTFNTMKMADDLADVARQSQPQRSAPRIACFCSDVPQYYFLFVESQVLSSVSQLSVAVMYWFILHYVLNLECCHSKDFLFVLSSSNFIYEACWISHSHNKTMFNITL